ncbi:MAG TPA: VCBS repeat-containing protein, partial [Cellvibrio sp.]|nr:VCBS repeat-containing protein [Cellvibrio sp.]
FHTTEGISRYDVSKNTLSPLVKTSSIYAQADSKRLPHSDMVVDVNSTGLSDLLIADFTVYHLWLQREDGSFAHFPLTVDAMAETHEEGPRYTPRKPYLVDINLDGRTDIVFARDDQLLVFEQNSTGGFPEQARICQLNMPISSDTEASLRSGDGRNYDGLLINRLFDVTDLDGDGLADVIIRRELFADALEQNYDYLIHYGRAGEGGIHFDKKPDARINTHGIQFESVFADIDGDGRKDFYTPNVHFGLGLMVRALISGSAGMEVQFYRMKQDRSFNEKPDHIHKTTASISISGGRVDLPLFQLAGHVDNTYKDLWVGEKQQRLIVNRSDENHLFDYERLQFNVTLPRDGSKVRVMDVNNDGQDDLVLPFDAQEKKELRNQVHFLIAK